MTKKSPDAFRTISEVAAWLNVPTHVLRFWESRFSQVKPVKRAGGRRYYRPADMALLGGIRKLLHEDGMTIRGVQKLLREEGVKHVAALSPPLTDPDDMKDITPSNVVTLKPGEKESAAAKEAVEDAEPVTDDAAKTEMAPDATEDTAAEPAPAPPLEKDTTPAQTVAGNTVTDAAPTGETAAETPTEAPAEDLLDTPEGLDFLAQDADVAPPEVPIPSPDKNVAENTPEPAKSPKPTLPDISHIPDDPPDDAAGEAPVGPTHLVLTQLRTARQTDGLPPANASAARLLAQRLTALKERMGQERRSHSAE